MLLRVWAMAALRSILPATASLPAWNKVVTQRWVTTLFQAGKEAVAAKMDLKAAMAHTRKSMDPIFGHVFIYEHCLPFDVSRAYDEAKGIKNPRIWTADRDKEMWAALQA